MNLYVYIIACCVFIGTVVGWGEARYRMGRHDGYAAAEDDRKIARAEARRGRHARTQPRQQPVDPRCDCLMNPAIARRTGGAIRGCPVHDPQPRTSLVGSPPALPPEMTPPRPIPQAGEHIHWPLSYPSINQDKRYKYTTATDIAPVVLPEPGTYLPGPRRNTGPNTVTFPKVQLDTATTGEIRAIGDEMVAAIEAAGEAS